VDEKDRTGDWEADTINGKEFANHEKLAEELEVDVYFAYPYASWERDLIENTNGLCRQYFPKGWVQYESRTLS
jgi:IS30 family transposase